MWTAAAFASGAFAGGWFMNWLWKNSWLDPADAHFDKPAGKGE